MEHLLEAQLAANTIRALSADAIQKAKSGHPGLPLGAADFAFLLYYKYLRHNPANPAWLGRDRFILSAGHGSMLLYSLLHLFEYGITMDEIKEFRQWGSRTAGHPELLQTPGVEVTTGPLGSGFASAIGMALAQKRFNAVTGLDKSGLFNNRYYILCGDGCLMEGCSYEAAALAGHLKLDNIICFYDSNAITIDGGTDLTFTENVAARFAACNWRVIEVANANNLEECDAALAEAQKSDGRPTLIIGHTVIGLGSPNKQGTSSCHGAPLGEEEVALLKQNLKLSPESFYVPEEVYAFCSARVRELKREAAEWDADYRKLLDSDSSLAAKVESFLNPVMPENLKQQLLEAAPMDKAVSTRVAGGAVLAKAAELLPALVGGSADVGGSTCTILKNESRFSADNYAGRNIYFGIRELAMGLIANGMALSGVAIPYVSTFFVFCDYMKPAMRLASLMRLKVIYVFTHDSFYVGEDGATHQPIEHATMLRTIPGFTVIRPADPAETAQAWDYALKNNGPTALLLTRQNLELLPSGAVPEDGVSKGAYVVSSDPDYRYLLIATGSELTLAVKAVELMRAKGARVRLVSMPSMEIFNQQSEEYRNSVIPLDGDFNRVSIEAGSTVIWRQYVGRLGLCIGIDHFGASAPAKVLTEKYGFTPEAVSERILSHFAD